MANANETLQNLTIHRQVDMQHFSNGEVRKVVALLNKADAQLSERLAAAIERLGDNAYTVKQMDSVLKAVRELNREIYGQVSEEVTADLEALSDDEIQAQAKMFAAAVPAPVLAAAPLVALDYAQVRAIAFGRPFQGRLLREWMGGLEEGRAARIRDTIRIGMVSGETTAQIVQRIRGTRAEGYKDGILDRSRRDIEAVVRTAISHVSNTARDSFYDGNDHLIKAIRWLSTLDGRTTPDCRVRDGKQFTPGSHKPIGHAFKWGAGPGRFHFCCRSTSVPVLKSWQELGIDLPEMTPGTRASMNGQVPADTTYADWLKGQSADRQDQILGPTRGKLYRDGKLTLDRFYNDKGRFLTLEQLAARGDVPGLARFTQPSGEFSVYDAGYPVAAPDVSTRARARAVEVETAIRRDARETGAFISPAGDVLLQRQGDVDSVAFPVSEFPRLRGATFTHNHPGNGTFSRADMVLAGEIGIAELRAIGPTLRYIMAPTAGWPSAEDLDGAVAQAAKTAQNRVTAMINRGELERRNAQAEFDHQVITQLAKVLKLQYTRERS